MGQLAEWTDTRAIEGPRDRTLRVGDRVVLSATFGLKVVLTVRALEFAHRFVADVSLPLSVINHTTLELAPLDAGSCKVSFG